MHNRPSHKTNHKTYRIWFLEQETIQPEHVKSNQVTTEMKMIGSWFATNSLLKAHLLPLASSYSLRSLKWPPLTIRTVHNFKGTAAEPELVRHKHAKKPTHNSPLSNLFFTTKTKNSVSVSGKREPNSHTWQGLCEFVQRMRDTRSPVQKGQLVEAHSHLLPLLWLILDNSKRFYFTGKRLAKELEKYETNATYTVPIKHKMTVKEVGLDDLQNMLEALVQEKGKGAGKDTALHFALALDESNRGIFFDILDKNLKIGLTAASLAKIFPGQDDIFSVALAQEWSEKTEIDFGARWYASRKYDGVRCITRLQVSAASSSDVTVNHYTRSGNTIEANTTLRSIQGPLSTIAQLLYKRESKGIPLDVALDGELTHFDSKGQKLENFSGLMSHLLKERSGINLKYFLFDILPWADLKNRHSDTTLSERLETLKSLQKDLPRPTSSSPGVVTVLPQTRVKNKEHLDKLYQKAKDSGWEGLMIRKDGPYVGQRNKSLLKMKPFHDAEYTVTGVEMGTFTVADKEGVGTREEEMVKALKIMHEDNEVSVGSGLTMDQRRAFYQNPDDILDKQILVQYQSVTKNKSTGRFSLRFPTIKHIYPGKRNT
eukprot:comp21154_c0_seq1/m.28642 comp21154_c0_seq1/g.28642  ORF comp21154_c0_seq1/g.28642 comp21154_c0_seq1/m.28642 type:complete len:599 (-) comp21154_c0_seq1:185-1981(-)